jgi:hypothetical protein
LVCCTSVGTADADAPPTSEKVNPAAPNAGTAALVTRFRFEACFNLGIVASSIPVREFRIQRGRILRSANAPCKTGDTHDHATDNATQRIQLSFMFVNDSGAFLSSDYVHDHVCPEHGSERCAVRCGNGFWT